MPDEDKPPILKLLGLPSPSRIEDLDLREEYIQFLQQLKLLPGADVVLSDPYFFQVETDGILDSVENWIQSLSSTAKTRLLLLSVLCRPFDPSTVWPNGRSRFVDDPVVSIFFGAPTISLAEGTSGVPFGTDVLDERRRVLNDPGMKQLMGALSPNSAIETLTSEFIGGQPGNYAYQAWQVSNWSREWAVVYGVSDAAHDEGYPFPWLFGFCRRNHLEPNFITLLREGASHFDWGFYSTYGKVWGQWRLAGMALSVFDDDERPRWDLVDQLLSLDVNSLASILEEGPDDPKEFLLRIAAIIEGAEEAGF